MSEEASNNRAGEVQDNKGENSRGRQNTDWRADLHDFFGRIENEDQALGENVQQVAHFYSEIARPALAEVSRELALYGRECETGEDAGRVFIIVRAVKDKVEFQYAVVVEAKIEGVTPYIHCWYEESSEDSESDEQDSQEEKSKDDGADEKEQKQKDDKDDEKDGDDKNQGSDDEKSGDDKSSGASKRYKTIEPLAGWNKQRSLESLTREEIISDFVAHYKDAVARLRSEMHRAETGER